MAAAYRRPSANDLAIVALDYALLKDDTDAEKWMMQALQKQIRRMLCTGTTLGEFDMR